MKKIFTLLSIAGFALNIQAQCTTGCTFNVSGLSTSNFYITAGQKLCIAPTGTVTGLIAVDGGILCNQGTIKTTNVLIANGATFNNYGKGIIDTLYIFKPSSAFNNDGTMTNVVMGTAAGANTTNNGTMIAGFLGDSIGTFINNGNLTINQDFFHAYSSSFSNNGYMSIGRDFYNSTNSIFSTQCMINVSRDWYNAASVIGATTGCGGFNITNTSLNSGTIGNASTHIDLCDANNPGSINGNSGTIASTTTYCSCASNACHVVGVPEITMNENFYLYPNPTSGILTIETTTDIKSISVTNYLDQEIITIPITLDNKIQIDLRKEPIGIYIVKLTTALGQTFYKKIIKH